MSAETTLAERWLHTTLSADSALAAVVAGRIYSYQAAARAALPYVVFHLQSGGQDIAVVGAHRVWADLLYAVKAVAEGESFGGGVETAAGRIDALLHRGSGTVTGGKVLMCVRERPLAYVENAGDRRFQHLGGLYRVWVQAD